jgi:hypothetical protein
MAGRANSAYNLTIFVSAFVFQWGLGLLIDLFQAWGAAPDMAMRYAFGLSLALQAVSLAVFALHPAEPGLEPNR